PRGGGPVSSRTRSVRERGPFSYAERQVGGLRRWLVGKIRPRMGAAGRIAQRAAGGVAIDWPKVWTRGQIDNRAVAIVCHEDVVDRVTSRAVSDDEIVHAIE